MVHLWDPLGADVLQAGGAGDGETDQEDILEQTSAREGSSVLIAQCPYSFRI